MKKNEYKKYGYVQCNICDIQRNNDIHWKCMLELCISAWLITGKSEISTSTIYNNTMYWLCLLNNENDGKILVYCYTVIN